MSTREGPCVSALCGRWVIDPMVSHVVGLLPTHHVSRSYRLVISIHTISRHSRILVVVEWKWNEYESSLSSGENIPGRITCVGKSSGGWNLFIISTSIHIETPALISNLPISKAGWAYQVQRGLIRLEIYLTHFPQFRLKLASSLLNCELLRVLSLVLAR